MKQWKRVALSCTAAVTALTQIFSMTVGALGKMDFSSPMCTKLINQVSFANVAPGVTEQQITLLNSEGKRVENFVLTVDLEGTPSTKIVTGSYNDSTGYGMSTVRAQAEAAQSHGKNVVAGVNADFYDMSTGVPIGCFVKDGQEIQALPSNWTFFGIQKNGTAVVGDFTKYQEIHTQLQEALGGNCILVKDGTVIDYSHSDETYFSTKQPRTAVGIKADGSVVFAVSDGRQDPYSTGLTMWDLGNMMKSLGCVNAINLDGGGSSTYISREQGTSELACKNSPSDGSERVVANSFLVVSNAQGNGLFTNASVTPSDKTYTPNSTVQMTAKGMDSAGNPAALPVDGLSWALSDSSFGSVNQNGIVTSSGKEGQVEVRLLYQGQVVGSSYIEFITPDEIFFRSSEISLPFDESSDLGFVAQYQGRRVILKEGDITWDGIGDMGTMKNNVLHTSPSGSVSGNVTAKLAGTSLSASISVQVGQLPVVLYDFENGLGEWSAGTAGRGEVTSVEAVNYASGEPVRFGNQSLKLNFDLTNAQMNKTLGAYAGPATSKEIPGMPKAIGAWVYATEEAKGYWLRCYVYDSTGQYKPINFTTQTEGINWTGWKYCEASLEGISGPYTTFPNQMFRMMSLKSGVTGPMTKGEIYIDNVRAVYGASVDDMYPPIINDINVDGKTYNTSAVTISTSFSENTEDKYATGMDYTKINVYVDGVNYKDAEGVYALNKGQNTVALEHISLPDGEHRTDVVVRDNFGNETKKTAYFTVHANTGTSVSFTPDNSGNAVLGSDYGLKLTSNQNSDVNTINAQIKLTKNIPVNEVAFAPGFTGTYTYNQSKGLLSVTAKRDPAVAASADGSIAAVKVGVPASLQKDSTLTFSVEKGEVTYLSERPAHYLGSFSSHPQTVGIDAAYQVNVLSRMVGRDGTVKVTDKSGTPCAGVTVNMTANGTTTVLGQTDEQGVVTSAVMTDTVKQFEIYAQKEQGVSFIVKGQTLPALGTAVPTNILANAVTDAATSKNISWMSNPLTSGQIPLLQIAKKSDYDNSQEAAFRSIVGTGKETEFIGSTDITANGIIRLNSAVVTGLAANTEYVYRVGDGSNWSQLRSFTQPEEGKATNFFVLGDTQTSNTANLESVLSSISGSGTRYDFGVHAGDMIDDAGRFDQLNAVSAAFSNSLLNSLDIIRTFGNHEYMGDDNATVAKTYYNSPMNGPDANKGAAYSVEYGDVYVAVFGFNTDPSVIQAQLDWLKADAKKSDKTWKILVTHQPVYYTNPEGGNGIYKEMVPSVLDEIGIDFMFSGHDHAYGRTKPMKNGVYDANGTVYMICGSTGEKYYGAVNDGSFDVFNDEQKPCYITVSADSSKFSLTALRPDGTVLDTYTKTLEQTDKQALQTVLEQAQKQVAEGKIQILIPSVQASFTDALNTASAVYSNKRATQAEVNEAYKILMGEMQKLDQIKGDKTALQKLYDEMSQLDLGQYEDGDAKNAFVASLQAAGVVIANADATQNDVDVAKNTLSQAMQKLALKPGEDELKARTVENMILALPDANSVTMQHADAISSAYQAYFKLSNLAQSFISASAKSKLESVCAALRSFTQMNSSLDASITAEPGTHLDPAAELRIVPAELSTGEQDALNQKIRLIASRKELVEQFDISLVKNQMVLQPDGKVTVKIKLTDSQLAAYEDFQMAYVSDSGEVTPLPTSVENGYVIFTVSHFSSYAIIGTAKAKNENPDSTNSSADNTDSLNSDSGESTSEDVATGDRTSADGIVVLSVCALLLAVLTVKKRRYSK